MIQNWAFAFKQLLVSEGGFTDDPHDKGNQLPDGRAGSTMLGVTQAEWEKHLGHQVTHDDMRKLTPAIVEPFYKAKYWDAVRADELPSGVDYAIFDAGVNTGTFRAVQIAQRVASTDVDGAFGPKTMAAIKAVNPKDFIARYTAARLDVYKTFNDFNRYGVAWTNRINRVSNDATKMSQTA